MATRREFSGRRSRARCRALGPFVTHIFVRPRIQRAIGRDAGGVLGFDGGAHRVGKRRGVRCAGDGQRHNDSDMSQSSHGAPHQMVYAAHDRRRAPRRQCGLSPVREVCANVGKVRAANITLLLLCAKNCPDGNACCSP